MNGVSLFFGALGATDGTSTGWASRGFDRDGLCTTTASTDVCNRQGGAAASYQEDGNDGIDNAWGHVITPFLKQLDPTEPSGYLVTDSTGKGTLVLGIQGTRINVPITFARVVRNGTTATVSAVIPTEAFVTEMGRVAGHLSTSLCDGSTLDSIKQSIRQASDVPLDLAQDPSVACSAITLGAILTNVTDDTPSPIGPQPDPCL